MRYVQDAIPGNDEKGYSQALLGVDGEWRGMEVRALPLETAVIENDAEAVLQTDEDREWQTDVPASTDDDRSVPEPGSGVSATGEYTYHRGQ